MAQPTSENGYVYCWTDQLTNMLYVGIRKGDFDPNYISTSKSFNEAYHGRPTDFTRQVIANCTWAEALMLETMILKSANAAKSTQFYNKTNGNKRFVCLGHSEETRSKMSATWKKKETHNCDNNKAIEAWRGSTHSAESRAKMSASRDKYRTQYSLRMKSNNPMSNPDAVAKMLETRKKNKELRNGSTNVSS